MGLVLTFAGGTIGLVRPWGVGPGDPGRGDTPPGFTATSRVPGSGGATATRAIGPATTPTGTVSATRDSTVASRGIAWASGTRTVVIDGARVRGNRPVVDGAVSPAHRTILHIEQFLVVIMDNGSDVVLSTTTLALKDSTATISSSVPFSVLSSVVSLWC